MSTPVKSMLTVAVLIVLCLLMEEVFKRVAREFPKARPCSGYCNQATGWLFLSYFPLVIWWIWS